jgi:hypothetical protein
MRRRVCALVVAAGVLLGACGGDDGPGTVHLYDRAPVPAVPDRTAAVSADGDLPDGDYWAELTGWSDGNPPVLDFRLTQAFFADTCTSELGADRCANDYGVQQQPERLLTTATDSLQTITVVAGNRQNYAITADELGSLAGGNAPSAPAPADFTFGDYPFLVTLRDGVVVAAHQIWVP